ncbi:hypothetical protein GSI_11827 [Ganoderma sinense ZZ0214-1]|uniref:DUF6533 domain-containing protein n=1 Tax=Ganoderma sinense ZZ0214-1 TaxID=1077348 RepID=A0A2G8RX31_9APHY|nr:hypothetical protein GSI_11827 [Ganoderma sinense ZZ0214-1]
MSTASDSDALAADILLISSSTQVNHIVQAISFSACWYPGAPTVPGRVLISPRATAILYFDFFLTLPAEVDRYWTGNGCSWASFFFFLNRYMSVICHIPIIYEFFWSMPESWAVLGGKGTLPDSHDVSRWVGCDLRVTQKQGYYVAASWSSVLVFDATVFGLTLWQALNVGRMWSHSLFHIILRDGTIYFWILAVCYTANIMTNIFAQPELKGVLTTLTNVCVHRLSFSVIGPSSAPSISTSLVSRMMLNIRNPELLELPHRWPSEHWEL